NQTWATVESARRFMAEKIAEKDPLERTIDNWKAGIRWFFQNGVRREWHELKEMEDQRIEPSKDWERDLITVIRRRGMALKTEQTYFNWCRRFARKLDLKDPRQAAESQVSQFLDDMVVNT